MQDEWVVCRVFQKSAAKKYPTSNQSRTPAVIPYSLEIGSSCVAASPSMQFGDPTQFSYGRNFIANPQELAELSRVFRGGGGSTSASNPSMLGLGGGYFTMSGSALNLNLGGTQPPPPPPQQSQSVFRPMPAAPPAPWATMNQMMNTASGGGGSQLAVETSVGFGNGTDMNNVPNGHANRFMNVEHCMDLDTYWPAY